MKDFEEEQSRVEFIGLNDASDNGIDASLVGKAAENSLNKIKKITKHPTRLVVHIKMHEVEGKRKKFSIHSKIFVPGIFLEASHAEWDLISAVKKSLSTLEKEVIKKFKN